MIGSEACASLRICSSYEGRSSRSWVQVAHWVYQTAGLVRKMSNYFSPFPCDKAARARYELIESNCSTICLVRRFFNLNTIFHFSPQFDFCLDSKLWNQLNFGRSIRRNPVTGFQWNIRNRRSDNRGIRMELVRYCNVHEFWLLSFIAHMNTFCNLLW